METISKKGQRLLLFYIGKGLNIINKNRPKQFCLYGVLASCALKRFDCVQIGAIS